MRAARRYNRPGFRNGESEVVTMPLGGSAPALSSALRAALLGANAGFLDNAALTGMCDAIADAVLNHVVANALVNVPALGIVAPPGVAGGPCTGAAVGTIA